MTKQQQAQRSKQALLSGGGFAPVPHNLGRDVLPRLVAADKSNRDAVVLYVYLLAHTNGDNANERYMAAWVSVEQITQDTGIRRHRVKALIDVLEGEGLLETAYDYTRNRREKLYYPLYMATGGQ